MDNQTKQILFEYCEDDSVHSTLNITFKELLLHVFSRIEQNEHRNEIKAILNVEMSDSLCKCFTGRVTRLINCLNGFDDLVKIEIAENEQMGQIISLVKEQLEETDEYTVEKHKEIVSNELRNREYSDEIIVEWMQFIE